MVQGGLRAQHHPGTLRGLTGAVRIHHVNLVVPPGLVEPTADFWRSVFGLVDIPRRGRSPRPGAWLGARTFEVHLSEREGAGHPDAHVAVAVPDVAAVRAACLTAGAPWEAAPAVFGTGRGFTRDPGGNRVEVVQDVEFDVDAAQASEVPANESSSA